jgi:type II secretory pathway pseudopilin PulG
MEHAMNPKRTRRRSDETGVTLVELLVAIVVTAVILAALTTAFFVTSHNESSVQERLTKSHDAQLAASYIVADAQNTSGAEVSVVDTATCSDPNPPVSGPVTPLARLNWTDVSSAGPSVPKTANYVLTPNPAPQTGNTIMRRYCEGGVLKSDQIVGHSVASATAACSSAAGVAGPCPSTGSAQLTVSITETPDQSGGAQYQYSLTGAFRKVPAGGVPPSAPPPAPLSQYPFLMLGTSSTVAGLTVSGGGQLKVNNGIAVIDSLASPPVVANGGGTISGASQIDAVGPCTGNKCSGITPPITPIAAPGVIDPYQALSPPPLVGTTYSGSSYQGPGIYTSQLNITSDTVFASGTYILENGISITGSPKVTGVGVLLYIAGGSVHVGGSGTVNLSAQTTGPYAGILIFQDRTDTAPLQINGTSGTYFYGGLIYAPRAPIDGTGNGAVTVSSVIGSSATIGGSGTVQVG